MLRTLQTTDAYVGESVTQVSLLNVIFGELVYTVFDMYTTKPRVMATSNDEAYFMAEFVRDASPLEALIILLEICSRYLSEGVYDVQLIELILASFPDLRGASV